MSKANKKQLLSFVAGVVFFAGLVLATVTLLQYGVQKRHYKQALKNIRELETLEGKFTTLEQAAKPAREICRGTPANIESVTRNIFPVDKIDGISRRAGESVDGFTSEGYEVKLKGVALKTLPNYIRLMETLRPLARLVRCDIKASTPDGGVGDVVLEFDRTLAVDP